MLSLLEKEGRDPVNILHEKLNDSSNATFLNTKRLREIKNDYLTKQDCTEGRLKGFIQAHVDEIERASALLAVEFPVTQISEKFDTLQAKCRSMNKDLAKKNLVSGVSIARHNLQALDRQISIYEELPTKIQELKQQLQSNSINILRAYMQWEVCDDWRQDMLRELKILAGDRIRDVGSRELLDRMLLALDDRITNIEALQQVILEQIWLGLQHSIELVQFNKQRLVDTFTVLEMMEKRRRQLHESKEIYLNNQLTPVQEYINSSWYERCEKELTIRLTQQCTELFRFAEKEMNQKETKDIVDSILNAANQLLMELEMVETDVVSCFPVEIDIMWIYTSTYASILETEVLKLCDEPHLSVAHRLQLVEWIEYYNQEIQRYGRSQPSLVLSRRAQSMMSTYIATVSSQIDTWVTNIWNREEQFVQGTYGEMLSTRPNDIMNILKSQIAIAMEWLTGNAIETVVFACLDCLVKQVGIRFEYLKQIIDEQDVEVLCCFMNDTDNLQSKCPELLDDILVARNGNNSSHDIQGIGSNNDRQVADHIQEKFDSSSSIIADYAVSCGDVLVSKILEEVQHDTSRLWFSKRWDAGEPVVAMLLATLDDYFVDIKRWLSGAFFFAKIVRRTLDECVSEYILKFLQRTHGIPEPSRTCSIVAKDMENELRRSGLRSQQDFEAIFERIQLIQQTLSRSTIARSPSLHTYKHNEPPLLKSKPSERRNAVQSQAEDQIQHQSIIDHAEKLIRSSSTIESTTKDKNHKEKEKDKKLKQGSSDKKLKIESSDKKIKQEIGDKEKNTKSKKLTSIQRLKTSAFGSSRSSKSDNGKTNASKSSINRDIETKGSVDDSGNDEFEVQTSNLAAFLGS